MSLQVHIHLDGQLMESLTDAGPDAPVQEAPPTWVDDEPAGKGEGWFARFWSTWPSLSEDAGDKKIPITERLRLPPDLC